MTSKLPLKEMREIIELGVAQGRKNPKNKDERKRNTFKLVGEAL